jgi:drug/metabolite transporter (DMT)-like permease
MDEIRRRGDLCPVLGRLHKGRFAHPHGEWWPLIWLAILLVVQIILLNLGITYTTAGHACVLIVTSAIWVTVLSHFFIPGDYLSPVRLIGILIAYLGIIVISGDSLIDTDAKNLILTRL